jgi:hypothetical protein
MNQLVHFENAKRELQLATNVDEVKDLRDKAEALRLYMKQAGESLWMQNQCAEIKVRAERRAGELLKAKEKHRGFPDIVQSHDVTPPPKLEEIGISRKQSSRWQAIADIPEPQGKYSQLNDTWGRCVPIIAIEEEVGLRKYNLAEQADDSRSDNPPSGGASIGGVPRFMGVR